MVSCRPNPRYEPGLISQQMGSSTSLTAIMTRIFGPVASGRPPTLRAGSWKAMNTTRRDSTSTTLGSVYWWTLPRSMVSWNASGEASLTLMVRQRGHLLATRPAMLQQVSSTRDWTVLQHDVSQQTQGAVLMTPHDTNGMVISCS